MKSLQKTFEENPYKAISIILIGLILLSFFSIIVEVSNKSDEFNEECKTRKIKYNNKTIKAVSFDCDINFSRLKQNQLKINQ